jgi:shikimate kinase
MKIYFCGMIGAGKTTLGERLARELSLPFFDLDREMDRELGYSFHRLVAEQGWVPFRELEYAICKRFAQASEGVFCLGGGTVRYEWNRDLLAGTGLVILLTADEETLIERVRQADRPRVNPDADLEDDIRRLWSDFRDRYRAAADLEFRTDRGSVEEEVAELARVVREHLGSASSSPPVA